MTFFAVDDGLHSHPKWLSASHRARGLWTTAGSWCSKYSHDGIVPRHMLRTFGYTEKDAAALVSSGLWHTVRGGWQFHDWIDRNPDAATVAAVQAKKSVGGAVGNHVRWHVKRNLTVPGCAWCDGTAGEPAGDSESDRSTDSDSDRTTYRPNANTIPRSDGEPQASIVTMPTRDRDGLTLAGGLDGIA